MKLINNNNKKIKLLKIMHQYNSNKMKFWMKKYNKNNNYQK